MPQLMIRANFAYLGQTRYMHLLMASCAACALWSLVLGLYRIETGLVVLAPIAAAFTLWTGWILRKLPSIGRAAVAIFALRALVALARPYFADSTYLFEYFPGLVHPRLPDRRDPADGLVAQAARRPPGERERAQGIVPAARGAGDAPGTVEHRLCAGTEPRRDSQPRQGRLHLQHEP